VPLLLDSSEEVLSFSFAEITSDIGSSRGETRLTGEDGPGVSTSTAGGVGSR
jgi:hypothetical protein